MKFDRAPGNTATPLIRRVCVFVFVLFFFFNPLLTALTGFHCIHVCTRQCSQRIKELDWQFEAPSPSPEITFSWNWSYCVAANVNFSVVYVVWTDTRPVIKTLYSRLHHNLIQHETRGCIFE